jgi:hypothetical protein
MVLSDTRKRKETHGEPEASVSLQEASGRKVEVRRYSDLHFQEARELSLKVIEVERESSQGSKRDPRQSWFVTDAVTLFPYRRCLRATHFVSSREHGFRFLKQDLLWTRVHVRTPEQVSTLELAGRHRDDPVIPRP